MSPININSFTKKQSASDIKVEKNLALVHSIVKRYLSRGVDYDDLFQIGCIGLLNAVKRFNPDMGFAFSTYAVSLIDGEIKRFFRDDGMIKVSRHLKEVAFKTNMYIKSFCLKYGREPTIFELSETSGISVEELTSAQEAVLSPRSIFEETSEGKSIFDSLPACDSSGDNALDKLIVKSVIKSLPDRERKLIIYRYYKDKTQKETALLLGLSQVQVSRLEKKLLEKLKRKLSY